MVDELLCLRLCEDALLHVALYIDVEESGYTSHRHGSSVLCFNGSQIAEVEPLHSLLGACGRLGNVAAVAGSHLFHALERLDLHGNLLAQADDLVAHRSATGIIMILLLLFNQEVDAIEGNAARSEEHTSLQSPDHLVCRLL